MAVSCKRDDQHSHRVVDRKRERQLDSSQACTGPEAHFRVETHIARNAAADEQRRFLGQRNVREVGVGGVASRIALATTKSIVPHGTEEGRVQYQRERHIGGGGVGLFTSRLRVDFREPTRLEGPSVVGQHREVFEMARSTGLVSVPGERRKRITRGRDDRSTDKDRDCEPKFAYFISEHGYSLSTLAFFLSGWPYANITSLGPATKRYFIPTKNPPSVWAAVRAIQQPYQKIFSMQVSMLYSANISR